MTTMRVEKAVHKQIKDYCNQAGRDIGQWPEAAIKYLLKNHVDIFDGDVYIPFEEVKDDAVAMLPAIRNGIDKMTDIMTVINTSLEKATENGMLQERVNSLQEQVRSFQERLAKANAELDRIDREQRTWGKIQVRKDF